MNPAAKAKEDWKVLMRDRLLNLFLEVHRFSCLTVSDALLHDAAYVSILSDVLFNDLRGRMKRQVWVKTPMLQVQIRDLNAILSCGISKLIQGITLLLQNCEKLCLVLVPEATGSLTKSSQGMLQLPLVTRLELTII